MSEDKQNNRGLGEKEDTKKKNKSTENHKKPYC